MGRSWSNLPARETPKRQPPQHFAQEESASPHWGRYQFYIKRVRSVVYDTSHHIRGQFLRLAPEVLHLISTSGPLPIETRSIEWRSSVDFDNVSVLGAITPSSLTHLQLHFFAEGHFGGIPALFHSLISLAPDLKLEEFHYIRVLLEMENNSLEAAFLVPFLQSQDQLRTLGISCDRLDAQVIVAVGGLPKLRRLELCWKEYNFEDIVSASVRKFAELCPHLEEVKLQWTPSSRPDVWDISPLLEWDLVDVDIEGHVSIGRQVDDLERMAKAWPRLHRLKMSGYRHLQRMAPLSTLERIAGLFPNLVELALALHIDESKLDTLGPTPDMRFYHLRTLRVTWWSISETAIQKVAGYLARLCPHGGQVLDYGTNDDRGRLPSAMRVALEHNQKRWQQVARLMDDYNKGV